MTSKNSFSTDVNATMNFRQRQRSIAARRLVPWALSGLYFFVSYILATILALVDGTGRRTAFSSHELYLGSLRNSVSMFLGSRQMFWFGIVVGAVIVAVEGFSYLYDRRKVDFYESLPEKKRTRFNTIYVSGLFIFFVPFLTAIVLSSLIVTAYGLMNGALLADIACGAFRAGILFLGVYHIAMVGALLSGTALMGNLVTAFLLLAEAVTVLVMVSYKSVFFRTYFSDGPLDDVHLSPVFNHIAGSSVGGLPELETMFRTGSAADVFRYIAAAAWRKDLVTVLIIAVAFLAARALFLRRRNESAGSSLAFPAVKPVIKTVVCVVGTLVCGLIVNAISSGSMSGATLLFTVAVLVIAAAVLCCMAEAVFAQSIRAAFRKLWQIPLIAGLSVLVFLGFRYDVFGYDRYVPAENRIDSAALRIYGNASAFYEMNNGNLRYVDAMDNAEKYMFLRNTGAIRELGLIGQTARRASVESDYNENRYNGLILYRLKSGRSYWRRIAIPTDVSPELMDSLIYTAAFREGAFEVYHNEAVEEFVREGKRCQLQYTDGITPSGYVRFDSSNDLYAAFAESYREDLKQFSYTMAHGTSPSGQIEFGFGIENAGANCYQTFPVYPSYSRTIAFLEKIGIQADETAAEKAPKVSRIVVTAYNYSEGTEDELENEFVNELDGPAVVATLPTPAWSKYGSTAPVSAEYTDAAQIEQILENFVSSEFPEYLRSPNRDNIEIRVDAAWGDPSGTYQDSNIHYGYFEAGKIPAFVLRDLDSAKKHAN